MFIGRRSPLFLLSWKHLHPKKLNSTTRPHPKTCSSLGCIFCQCHFPDTSHHPGLVSLQRADGMAQDPGFSWKRTCRPGFSHPTFPTFPGRHSGVGCCSWDDMQMVVCGSAHVLHAMASTTWHRSSVVGLRDDIIFFPFLSLARPPGITPKITTSHEDRHVKLPRWKLSETKFPCLRPDIV